MIKIFSPFLVFTLCFIFLLMACRKQDECIPACTDSYFKCIKGECICPGVVLNGTCTGRGSDYVYGTVSCGCLNDLGIAIWEEIGEVYLVDGISGRGVRYTVKDDGSYFIRFFEVCQYDGIRIDEFQLTIETVEGGKLVRTQYFEHFQLLFECTDFFE